MSQLSTNAISENFIDRSNGDYNLHIKSGETLELPAIDYFFDNVIIEPNAVLTVTENSENWFFIDCRQNFTLEGSILFKKFIADTTSRELRVNDVLFSHQFRVDRLGGKGGNSGFTDGNPVFNGAHGTTTYGGGGGAGGYWHRRSGATPGAHGHQHIGGATSFSAGGNGGIRKKYINGGLLFLNIGHDFHIGENNLIDLRGEKGENGLPGQHGKGKITGMSSVKGSGGGGGAPGGEGGVLYHKVRGNYSGAIIRALVNGGAGGIGGAGGLFPEEQFPSAHGKKGDDGEEGRNGFVKIVR